MTKFPQLQLVPKASDEVTPLDVTSSWISKTRRALALSERIRGADLRSGEEMLKLAEDLLVTGDFKEAIRLCRQINELIDLVNNRVEPEKHLAQSQDFSSHEAETPTALQRGRKAMRRGVWRANRRAKEYRFAG